MKLSVVLPCYNEEQNVKRIPAELVPVLDNLGCDYEIIAVNDGCTDSTVQELKDLNLSRLIVCNHEKNRGLAAALKTGLAAATGDKIIFLDTDFTFHPRLIPNLFKAEELGRVDFVIGSPFLGGYDKDIPRWRILVSKLSNFLYGFLLGKKATSINQIFRLYNTDDLRSISIESKGFEINAEILFKLVFAGKSFVEIPAKLTQREFGVSKLNYKKEIVRHLFLLVKIIKWKFFDFKKYSKRKVYDCLSFVVLAVLASAVSFFRLDSQSIWNDEGISIAVARKPLSWILTEVVKSDLHPPTYYLLLHIWQNLFGASVLSFRSLSAVAFVLSVLVVYFLARSIFKDKQTAFLSSILFIFNPFAIYYAQEIRSYSLLILFTCLNFLYFFRILEKKTRYSLLCYLFTGLILVYLNILSLIVLFVHGLYILCFKKRDLFKPLILGYALLFLSYLPFLIILFKIASGNFSYVFKETFNIFEKAATVLAGFAGGRVNIINAKFHHYDWLVASLLFYSTCFAYLFYNWKKTNKTLLFIGAAECLVMLAMAEWKFPAVDPKYFFFVFPFFILIFSNLLKILKDSGKKIYVLVFLISLFFNFYFIFNYFFVKNYERENWKGVVAMIEKDYLHSGGTALVVSPVAESHSTFEFYSHQLIPTVGTLKFGDSSTSSVFRALNEAGANQKDVIYVSRFIWNLYDPQDNIQAYLNYSGYLKVKELKDTKVEFWKYERAKK